MSRRHRKDEPWQHAPGAQQQPKRPHQRWRDVRKQAMGCGAPKSVRVVLDHIVETLALNPTWKVIKLGYGRHSERERAWDHRRRGELLAQAVVRRRDLVQLPDPEKEGFAERCDMSRRTVIRAGRWLVARGLAHIFHEHGHNEVPDKYGTLHQIGRGGCVPGGKGCAGVWLPGSAPPPGADPPPELDPSPAPTNRPSYGDLLAQQRAANGSSGRPSRHPAAARSP